MSASAEERRLVQPLAAVLSADEVMELLGLSPPTLRRLVKDGHLRAHRLPGGRKWLFRADEVLDSVGAWPPADAEDAELPLVAPGLDPPVDEEGVDPTTVWCPATRSGACEQSQLEQNAAAWIEAARRSGLSPVSLSPTKVEFGGRSFELRTGPRQRVRVVDDDGEEVWQLIDAVFAEPVDLSTVERDASNRQ